MGNPCLPCSWIPARGVVYERLTRGNGEMEVFRAVYEVGQQSMDDMSHPSLESVYVVRGVITAEIDKVSFDVKAGENISFDARQSRLPRLCPNLS